MVVACWIIVSVPVPFLWTLDLGLGLGLTIKILFRSEVRQWLVMKPCDDTRATRVTPCDEHTCNTCDTVWWTSSWTLWAGATTATTRSSHGPAWNIPSSHTFQIFNEISTWDICYGQLIAKSTEYFLEIESGCRVSCPPVRDPSGFYLSDRKWDWNVKFLLGKESKNEMTAKSRHFSLIIGPWTR